MATTLKQEIVRIRKPRKCLFCYRHFPIKTPMYYWVGVYEGVFQSHYHCLTCQEIIEKSDEYEFEEGYVFNSLDPDETPEQLLERK